jgi:tripartite-type tricarboxylate transporter receptor subunit TctC
VARLNTAINSALDRPAIRERLLAQGADPSPGSVSDFAALIKREFARYGKIVRESGIRLD